jgi:hypothetical protein
MFDCFLFEAKVGLILGNLLSRVFDKLPNQILFGTLMTRITRIITDKQSYNIHLTPTLLVHIPKRSYGQANMGAF